MIPVRCVDSTPPGCGRAVIVCAWVAVVLMGTMTAAASAQAPTEAVPAAGHPDPFAGPDGSGESASAPVRRRAGVPTDPREIIEALTWYFVAPFVAASFLAVWFGIERLVVLRRSRVIPKPFVERFVHHLEQGTLDAAKALKLCDENGSPVAQVFAHGVRKWGKPSVEVEQAIIDGGERQVNQLRKHLRVLNGVATVTPLIGLLGTVIGMIMAFNDIANSQAMGKAEQLAGGIALALLTTAAGLMIAIPSLIMYTYLSGRVDTLVVEMDDKAQSVVRLISAEGLTRRQAAAKARPAPVPTQPDAAPAPVSPKPATQSSAKKAV